MAFLNAFSAIGRFMLAATLACLAAAVVASGEGRAVFLVLALTLGITGLTFTIIGSRLGRVSSLSRALRATGVPGTATVTSVRDTNVRVNGAPVVEIGLEVDVVSHAPYATTIRQRMPFTGSQGMDPGMTVGVVVDPTNRETLAIDWDADVVTAAANTAAVVVDAAEDRATTSMVRSADQLLRTGRQARAMITSMEDAGDMSELGLVEVGSPGDDDRLFIIGMEVQQAGLDPYEVRVAHRVPERLLGRVGPRTRVKVAIDRDNDSAVAIDWGSVGH